MKKPISIEEYDYMLPDSRIASNPLLQRDSGKLLIYDHSKITENFYSNIDELLPEQTLVVFNNTSVIKARLYFNVGEKKPVEIFCLEPADMSNFQKALITTSPVQWNCLVGNFKKALWKTTLQQRVKTASQQFELFAKVIEKKEAVFIVEFSWDNELSFGEVLQTAGNVPLPPYIKRAPAEYDEQRYQTIYAENKGSVAAPTAGLHFTENIFTKLKQKNIDVEYVTLHVGAGTFMPVKTSDALQHSMHTEWMEVSKKLIEKIALGNYSKLVAVGTTSLRTLESMFWMGAKYDISNNKSNLNDENKGLTNNELRDDKNKIMLLNQWDAYTVNMQQLSVKQSMHALLNKLERERTKKLIAGTQLMIVPGYNYKMIDGLITNFHQPKSTLLLLVAALIGDNWKTVYAYALEHGFRFLSYGDGCLLWKNQALESSSR